MSATWSERRDDLMFGSTATRFAVGTFGILGDVSIALAGYSAGYRGVRVD